MGKTVKLLLGLAATVGALVSYRHDLAPFLPASVRHQAEEIAAHYLPSPFLAAFAGNDKSVPGAHATANSARAAPGKPGEAKAGEAKAGEPKAGEPKAANPKGGTPPVPVAAALVQQAVMPVILSAPGTVEAMATVNIKPRVDGAVVEVGFKEGDLVLAGSMLYRLDDRLALAQIKQAEANVARDQASLKDAEMILDRKETLLRNKYASEAQTETARQQVEVLKASINAGLATVDAQRTQLDYLTIRAPITGRTGSINAKLGAFVRSADLLPLLTINQTKPIAVSFALPQVNLDALKTALAGKSTAVVTVPGANRTKVTGVLGFVDNQVDKTTGTVVGKVMVDNADEALWPGQAVSVDLTVELRQNLLAVPASGVQPAQQGMIAWVIAADNTVSIRTVKQERVIDQIAYISDGLKVDDKIVTDGQMRLGPGARVTVRETTSLPASVLRMGEAIPVPAAATAPEPDKSPPAAVPKDQSGKLPEAEVMPTEKRKNKRG